MAVAVGHPSSWLPTTCSCSVTEQAGLEGTFRTIHSSPLGHRPLAQVAQGLLGTAAPPLPGSLCGLGTREGTEQGQRRSRLRNPSNPQQALTWESLSSRGRSLQSIQHHTQRCPSEPLLRRADQGPGETQQAHGHQPMSTPHLLSGQCCCWPPPRAVQPPACLAATAPAPRPEEGLQQKLAGPTLLPQAPKVSSSSVPSAPRCCMLQHTDIICKQRRCSRSREEDTVFSQQLAPAAQGGSCRQGTPT